jgi:hypothetical protein
MTRINDNGVERDMTETELAAYKQAQKDANADAAAIKAATEAKAAALTSARAKLSKLGLTDDELEALLGI